MKKPKPKSIFRKKNTALKTVHGILDITRYGMGFVEVPGMDRDILIRRDYLQGAMKGDEVEVAVFTPTGTKRAEGRIIKIIKRSQTECIGTVQKNAGFAFVVPDNSEFNRDIYISSEGSRPLKDGDRVWVRITDWSERMKNPEGEIIEVLDPEKQRDADMKEILLQAGFPLRFPADVMQESEALSMPSGPLPENRKDYRDVLTFTIDPEDARDFDDALSIKTLRRGVYEIGVHIADVSHFLEEGSALDLEAKKRATSVYLPDRVLPMLPERISNELCSLRPHEDRFTFSVLFEITEEAEVLNFQLCKTCIHSNRRFTYEEVQNMLDGSEGDYRNELLILNALSQKLRKEKMSKGAINFASEEIRFVLDEKGNPIGVKVKESLASHQLIEEWMLLANRTVSELASAKKWKNKAVPFPYRVHDIPDMDKLKSFALFAARFGHRFDLSSPEQIAHSFNRMIQQSAHEPSQQFLHTLGIRTMAKAHYTTGNIGHYGLGFEFYSHFTSPIRRYPDVLSHRILLALLENRSPLIHDLEAV